MTLEVYFKLSSYTLIVASFVMLAATGQLEWWAVAAFTLVVLVAALLDAGKMSLRHPHFAMLSHRAQQHWSKVLWILRFALIPLYWLDSYWFKTPSLLVAAHLVLAWSALHLLRHKTNGDWLRLYVASFFAVLLAASMTLDALFFVLLVVYLLAGLSTLVSFEIRRSLDEWWRQHQQPETTSFWRIANGQRVNVRTPRWRNVFAFVCLALVLIAVLATPLFLAMPRVPRQFPGDSARGEALSGFTERVQLGEVAKVKLSRQRVMRVRVFWPAVMTPIQLYWRGIALDYYAGGTWVRTVDPAKPVRGQAESFQLENPMQPPYTEQHFYLEPLNTNVIFAAPRAALITGPDVVKRDDSQSLYTNHHSFSRYRYQVLSNTTLPKADDLRTDQPVFLGTEMRRRYLQLPPRLDARIGQLAKDVAGDAANNYDVTMRLVHHLQNDYQYSLDLQVVEDGDPLSDFLFNTRTGHCEYFASALTILLRTRGIPARLVNGFQMGEYQQRSKVYVVRQSDAHSWVEAYFPRHGWVTFDPTPAAGLNQYDEAYSGMFGWLQQMGEGMQTFWQERVIEFDAYEQFTLLMNMQRGLNRWRNAAERSWFNWQMWLSDKLEASPAAETPPVAETATESARPNWRAVLLVLLVLTISAILVWWWRHVRSWRYRFSRDAAASAVAFYEEMLAHLARRGFRRQPAQTPREFARQINLPGVNELTQLYQQARFGHAALSASQIDRVSSLLRELQQKR
jgi:hypothetical protein